MGSFPKVVEKGIGMSYPIGKPTNRKGGYADEERIPPSILDSNEATYFSQSISV
jgi:hypothetical protein